MEREVFYGLISGFAAKSLRADAQSYLFCSADTDALMLLAECLITASEELSQASLKFNEGHNPEDSFQKSTTLSHADLQNPAQNISQVVAQKPYADNAGGGATSCMHSDINILSLPDVKVLPAGEKVLVSDIEEITSTAAVTPLTLCRKYYIIKNAHTMNDAAANKLLKTLEEPPKNVKIIVMTEGEYDVLPTVRSRCRVVNLPPFSESDLNRAADELYADNPFLDKAKALSLGSITRLKKAVNGEYEDAESIVFDILLNMKNSTMVARHAQAVNKKKGGLGEIIEMLGLVLSDVLRTETGILPMLSYRAADLGRIAQFYHGDTILRLTPVLEKAQKRLKYSGNAASITDELLFSLLEIRQKCQS